MAAHTNQRKKNLLAMADEQISKILQHRNMQAVQPADTVEMVTPPKGGSTPKKRSATRPVVLATQ